MTIFRHTAPRHSAHSCPHLSDHLLRVVMVLLGRVVAGQWRVNSPTVFTELWSVERCRGEATSEKSRITAVSGGKLGSWARVAQLAFSPCVTLQ